MKKYARLAVLLLLAAGFNRCQYPVETSTLPDAIRYLVIDAELISGIDSPAEIATARRMQQLRWLSERRQLPTAPDAKITAVRTLLGAFNATGAKITLGERERLTRAIEAVGAA